MTDQQVNRLEAASAALATADAAGQIASLRSDVPSFIVMDVMRAALEAENAGRHIIHMEVGQPGTPAPRVARDVAARALQNDTLGYTMALGNDVLRARIARHYADQHGLNVAPERIAVTAGSSAAFVLTFLSLFDAGDTVALPSPGYPCYRHILSALGQRSVLLETGPSNDWMPDPDDVLRAIKRDGIKGLLIASPANPTGTMISQERLRALTDVCQQHGVRFISDEIYHGLTYTRPADTALACSDDAIVINSFSKYFSMTGWRIGWMVVPHRLIRAVERLTQNLYISPPSIAQAAALGAFDARDELEANRDVYAANRELLLAELPHAGFTQFAPADGAFYLYCNVGELLRDTGSHDAAALARTLLDEAGVALTPGNDFDAQRGGQFLRFSYAGTTADMAEAARRLQVWANGRA
ncbi:aminotransferase class I/II-fold pyridoxal phosphate-dependent enzyme [Hyphomicrobium sp. D-2]|uniref:pyridoxal phosphate-dependent aminotransferase n=1 Tax=Hyphomicrobium sp. D-2 TaxID=3041621 RepID=UPI0024589409|nr:aminotransferase class I/II-fold pyridoxal phosphate-dependent enzyme [Hyphomicrobium sp. D-2]MDH4983900.1 aminotransferase class I/II-fold pyridoxal phosphate-dependent enzyme [Hyphomicrobium sp. D-2]